MRERNGQDVNIIRRLDGPQDDERYERVDLDLFPLYTVAFPDGTLWDAFPDELRGDRPGLEMCPRCDRREVNPLATSRVDSHTHICPKCEWHEAVQDMGPNGISLREEWPLANLT